MPHLATVAHRGPLTCADCGNPWPCDGYRDWHRPSMVLEMVAVPPAYGLFCLSCQKPWPCPSVGGAA
jgi:hypothetical protein